MNQSCVEVTVNTSPSSPKKEPDKDKENDANSSSGRASPEANCPICLGRPENKSFTDSCLHQFCFTCLLEWSKVKAECPLCKQSFKSIIHNVRSIEDYEQYYLTQTSPEGTLFVSREIFAHLESPQRREPFRYRTTAVSSYLDYFVRLEEAISHHVIPPGPTVSSTLWQRRRQRGTSDFRRNIYQQGLWVQRTTDITGRVRECSPEFYRTNPAQVHRLVPWLNRELNVLLYENSPHVQYVISRILELITQVPIRSPGFIATVAHYLGRHSEHFAHEFHSFAVSPFDLVGYDRHANYVGRNSIAHEVLAFDTGHEEDSDSDVQVLENPQLISPLHSIQLDSDSDDCVVLDCPPRAEPEIITLDSDDDDVVQISVQTSSDDPSQSTSAEQTANQTKPPTSHRPRLKRNWLTVNNVQVPTTSSASENINVSISIAHSSRSMSPTVSEASSSSWTPVRKKPTKVKRKKEIQKKKNIPKGKQSKSNVKPKEISDSETERSPSPAPRVRKTSIVRPLSSPSSDSDSDKLFVVTDFSSSSDESEYKPRLRSVVVKSTIKPEPRATTPAFSTSPSRSGSHDYDYVPHPSRDYLDMPSSSRSRSDSYKSSYSYRSRSYSSSSIDESTSKKCKHSKKKSRRDKY